MPSTYIPPEHSLVRYVQWSKLRKDGDDNVIGVFADAFKLRPTERNLSATWLEYFSGSRDEQITSAVQIIRRSRLKPKPKSGFAIGVVARISEAATKHKESIRVLHENEDDNPAHAAIHRWPRDNDDLFDELADEVWNEIVLNKSVPA